MLGEVNLIDNISVGGGSTASLFLIDLCNFDVQSQAP